MALRIIFLEEFGKAFVPKKVIPNLRKYLFKAGFNEVPYKFFGLLFYVSAVVTLIIFVLFIFPYLRRYTLVEIYIFSFIGWFAIQIFFVVLFILLIYFYLDLRIYTRTRKMEEQLPDFLEILSANLKGGMIFERALWAAVKPRFNVLGSEITKASKKVMTGYEVSKALTELSDKYDSLMLRRTVDLIISELESGGVVAELIDRIADNLKETKSLKDEMSASAIAYVIFISTIIVVVSPLLFALSYHLLALTLNFISKLSTATQGISSLPFVLGKSNINAKELQQNFRTFSLVAVLTVAFFSSLIVAIVEKGEMKGGLKYIPIYIFGSLAFYLLFMKGIGALFGGL